MPVSAARQLPTALVPSEAMSGSLLRALQRLAFFSS